MRRALLIATAMAVAVVVASGVAWADNITGTAGNDKLQGTSGNDNMDGKAGNDTLEGMSGADSVLGANGDDLLYGGRADGNSVGERDEVRGQDGNDTVFGGSGADDLYGGTGNDAISDALEDDSSVDKISGGDGDDTINTVSAPASKDEITSCGLGNDVVYVDDLDVVASDCEEVRDAYADVSFSTPVPVAEALQVAEQADAEVTMLEDDFVVGGEPLHDGYIEPPKSGAVVTEQGYEEERLAFFQDMINEHDDPGLTPEERAEEQPRIDAMKAAVASGDTPEAQVTEMTLSGNEQELQNLSESSPSLAVSDTSDQSAGNIENVEIVQMSADEQRTEQEQNLEPDEPLNTEDTDTEGPSPNDAGFAASSSGTWYPNSGRSKVAPSAYAGRRYVSQRFTWNDLNRGSAYGYEHDFKTQNGSGYHYLTGAQTRLCYPSNGGHRAYWSTSYPGSAHPYLETNLTSRGNCERDQLTYTVGVAEMGPLVSHKEYFTFIRTPNGNAPKDNARLTGELVHEVPAGCYSVSCMFKSNDVSPNPRVLLDTGTSGNWFSVPSTKYWQE